MKKRVAYFFALFFSIPWLDAAAAQRRSSAHHREFVGRVPHRPMFLNLDYGSPSERGLDHEDKEQEGQPKRRRRTVAGPAAEQSQPPVPGLDMKEMLSNPHFLPVYGPIRGKDIVAASDLAKYSQDPSGFYFGPEFEQKRTHPPYLCCETEVQEPQTAKLCALVMAACTAECPETELKEHHSRIYDLLNKGPILATPNIVIRTPLGLAPLLLWAVCFCPHSDTVRLLAEKSSVEMRTIVLNTKEARRKIRSNPDLSAFWAFEEQKVCTCPSSHEEV